MGFPRRRFCPRGHDKEAPDAVYLYPRKTLKGTPTTWLRLCKKCVAINKKQFSIQLTTAEQITRTKLSKSSRLGNWDAISETRSNTSAAQEKKAAQLRT